jgi:acyl-coenzyme A thioesterase PaaI-like protein
LLRLTFSEPLAGEVEAFFTAAEDQRGRLGILQGGITSALPDETTGAAVTSLVPYHLPVATAELVVRFRRPTRCRPS